MQTIRITHLLEKVHIIHYTQYSMERRKEINILLHKEVYHFK